MEMEAKIWWKIRTDFVDGVCLPNGLGDVWCQLIKKLLHSSLYLQIWIHKLWKDIRIELGKWGKHTDSVLQRDYNCPSSDSRIYMWYICNIYDVCIVYVSYMMYVLHTMYMMHTMYLMQHDQKFVRLPPSSTCDKSCDTQLLFQQLVNKVPTTNLSHSVFINPSHSEQK